MNLLSLLIAGLTSTASVNALAKKTGISAKVIKVLLPIAIPILLKALTNNASEKEGASSLLGALSQHKSTDKVDAQLDAADAEDGGKILQHILGGRNSSVMNDLAGQTGLTDKQVAELLSNVAPVLLSSLSAANTTASSEAEISSGAMANPLSLMGLLGGQAQETSEGEEANGSLLISLLSALAK